MPVSETPVVIVTGASRGIGAAVASFIGERKAAVTLAARSGAALEGLAQRIESLGGRALAMTVDLTDAAACRSLVQETVRVFGRIDALVNNAGTIEPIAVLADVTPAGWHFNLALNLLAPAELIRAAIPHLRVRMGRVVNVGSGAAVSPIHGAGPYCAAKAALNHLTRVLAEEEPGITVLSVRPGVVDTEMQRVIRIQGPGVMPRERAAYYLDLKEAGRLEPPEKPGRAIAWLALQAPHEWSGAFLDYDDPRITEPAAVFFGKPADSPRI